MGIQVPQRSKEFFDANLRAWREREDISQSKASPLLGITINTMQNWEIARTKPNSFTETALSAIVDAPPQRKTKR
jgi:DNA-binding transcriptional regulator YiaG